MSGLLLQILGFIYQVLLSRMAGAQALGVYRLVLPVYSIVMSGTVSGIRLAVTSLSAGLNMNRDLYQIRILVRRSVGAFLFLFALAAIPAVLLRNVIAQKIIGDPATVAAMLLALCCIFLSGFEGIFESVFLGVGKTKYTAISNLLEQAVKIFVILGLVWSFGKEGQYGRTAALIMLGMTLCEIPVIIWLLTVYYKEVLKGGGDRSQRRSLRVLYVAWPVSFSGVITTLISSASVILLPSRLMVAGMTKTEAVSALGIVSEMALPLITLPMVLIRSLSNVLLPTISRSMAHNNNANVGRKIQKAFQATGIIVLPATAILVPLAPTLAELLYRQKLGIPYVLILAVGTIFTYYEMIAVSILNGIGKERVCMVSMIIGEGIQLLCTYYLAAAPILNIFGYMLGMIVSPVVVLIIDLVLIYRYTGYVPNWMDSFIIPALAAGVAGGFSLYFYKIIYTRLGSALLSIGSSILFSVSICLLIFLISGLRPIRYFKTVQVKKNKRGIF